MTRVTHPYAAGAPWWIETLQPDVRAAARFYGALLGWRFTEGHRQPRGLVDGEYLTASLDGLRVAGIGPAPGHLPAAWLVHVRVDDVERTIAQAESAGGRCLVAAVDGDDRERAAVLTDATGVPFGVRQSDGQLGAELVDEPGAWAMTSLHTTDPEEAQRFYGAVLGWRLEPAPGSPFSTWRLGDDLVGIVAPADGAATPPHWSINVAAEDPDAVAARATALGGRALLPPFDTPGFRNTVIADPRGAVIAVSART